MQNKILIVDNDIKTSSKYKKWLEEEGFNSTSIIAINNENRNMER